MGAVVEDVGNAVGAAVEQVFSDDDDGCTGGTDVFLCARVNQTVVGNVKFAREDFAGHIANERRQVV